MEWRRVATTLARRLCERCSGKWSYRRPRGLRQAAPGDERWHEGLHRAPDDVPLRPEGREDGRAGQHDLRHEARGRWLEDRQLDLFGLGRRCPGEMNGEKEAYMSRKYIDCREYPS